jgi:hypothetical protein
MTMSSNFQNRLSSEEVIQLTNPKNRGATSIDTTRLNNAISDVEGYFQIHANTTYDDTDGRHVAVAMEGLELILRKRHGNSNIDLSGWIEELVALGKVTGRNRISPDSSSVKTVAVDTDAKKPFDLNRDFGNIIPDRGL